MAYVTNERDNTLSAIDLDQMKTVKTVPVGQRPRGITMTKDGSEILVCASDDDTIQIVDPKSLRVVGDLPSGPDPETFALHVSGNPLYVSNENDNMVTVIDVADAEDARPDPDRRGAGRDGRQPRRKDDRQYIRNHQHGALLRFRHAQDGGERVGRRPSARCSVQADGSEVWVSSELGGTVSVIDPEKHVVTHKIEFAVQGLRAEGIQPVGIRFTKDDATAFVALGPANRVAVIDTKTYTVKKYLLVGQRVWQMAFTPDGKYLLTTNGLSNDVSVIDVASLEVVKSIPVGRLPWGDRGGTAMTMLNPALAVNGVSHAYGAAQSAGRRQPGRSAGAFHRAVGAERCRQDNAVFSDHPALRHAARIDRRAGLPCLSRTG